MYAWLLKWLQDVRASYWFVPACLTLGAIALAALMHWVDTTLNLETVIDTEWFGAPQPDGVQSVLNVIAGSVLGVAGVTFSITMVAVSFASANFGPRLIENFMRDRGNQFTLGIFIGTFVYSLLVLRTVHGGVESGADQQIDAFIPYFSILTALLLTLISVAALIYYIHHVPETINVSNIAADIGGRLRASLDDRFPAVAPPHIAEARNAPRWEDRERSLRRTTIDACADGYVQTVDIESIYEIAEEHAILIELTHRPGDFVVASDRILCLWSKDPVPKDCLDTLNRCFAVGTERTATQNILFLADQLVEIIIRALSPGVNDPFTAITCLNWLKASAVRILQEDEQDDPEDAYVRVERVNAEQFLSVIFDQTRQYVAQDRNTALHTLIVIEDLTAYAQTSKHETLLKRHAEALQTAMGDQIEAA